MSKGSQTGWWETWAAIALLGVCVVAALVPYEVPARRPFNALASILCIGLIIRSWLFQRRALGISPKLVFRTLMLALPGLAAGWLGLNVIRFDSYDPDSRASLYWWAVESQVVIVWLSVAVTIALALWMILANEQQSELSSSGRHHRNAMKKSWVYIYLGVAVSGVLVNFALWRYRLHLYELDTDYSREPLQHIQNLFFRGTQIFIVVGFLVIAGWKFVGGRKQ